MRERYLRMFPHGRAKVADCGQCQDTPIHPTNKKRPHKQSSNKPNFSATTSLPDALPKRAVLIRPTHEDSTPYGSIRMIPIKYLTRSILSCYSPACLPIKIRFDP